jgi:hypothetical protein
MRAAVNMSVKSMAETLNFYVGELSLFDVKRDYGMGTVLISYKKNDGFGLMLTEISDFSEPPKFFLELEVENCDTEFERVKKSLAKSKGYIYAEEGEMPGVFEYPVGKNFLVVDPFGNKILIFEDYNNSL